MTWGNRGEWMATTDDHGFVKYWQSNMNNVHTFQAHNDPVRSSRWEHVCSFGASSRLMRLCVDLLNVIVTARELSLFVNIKLLVECILAVFVGWGQPFSELVSSLHNHWVRLSRKERGQGMGSSVGNPENPPLGPAGHDAPVEWFVHRG